MTVEDLIQELQRHPKNAEVKALVEVTDLITGRDTVDLVLINGVVWRNDGIRKPYVQLETTQ